MKRLKSTAGHAAREVLVHLRRQSQSWRLPRVLVFPSHGPGDGASRLRAYFIADALRGRGWRSTIVPHQLGLSARRRIIAREKPDVILLQQARHPLNRPGLYAPTPCVFDIDDADWFDPAMADRATGCCRDAASVIAGSRAVAEWCRARNPHVSIIWTGTPLTEQPSYPPQKGRGPVVAWANSMPLGYPLEAKLVCEALTALAARRRFTYWIYGVPTNGEPPLADHLGPIRAAGIEIRTWPFMKYGPFIKTLEGAAVGLQPVCTESPFSRGKSFGKILAYLAAGVPVVASDAVDHGLFFQDGTNGRLVAQDVSGWVDAIDELLTNADRRQAMADAAYRDALIRLSTEAAAAQTDEVLRSVMARTPR